MTTLAFREEEALVERRDPRSLSRARRGRGGPLLIPGRPLLSAFTLLALLLAAATVAFVESGPASAEDALAREIFEELIEIDTTDSAGDNTVAAEAMARRLRNAGFAEEDVRVLGPHPRKGNLVARLRGSGKRAPILLLAHIDVVEALPSDWSFDPFTFLDQDGYFYGRGTSDDKAMAAIWIANLIRMKREGAPLERDLIVALTADEEGGRYNGVQWLLENHRDLLDAAYCLNEGGGGQMKEGRKLSNSVQLSEKLFQSFSLEVTNPGGHSSWPRKDNAIYQLSSALVRISEHEFPVELDEITSAYFEKMSAIDTGETAQDMRAVSRRSDLEAAARLAKSPFYNAVLRTTCVATELSGGHAENALPQTARATVNCRIFPGSDPRDIKRTLEGVVADEAVRLAPLSPANPSLPSPLLPEVMGAIERITEEMWPGVPVVPTMSSGATDGLYLRNAGIPTYGVSGIFGDIDDARAHGKDERILVSSFYEGREFLYRLMRALSSSN
jgi:acetylornithine deacetylase/succinyl-diaminopimelate desuccinylase-like protein